MEDILSSIKRIIAEDKSIDGERDASPSRKPELKAVPDEPEDDGVLELTEELTDEPSAASGVFGDRRKEERLINDEKLDAMRQSLSTLVALEKGQAAAPVQQSAGTSLEDLTRELMRPMLKQWLDDNLPKLVEELVAREIERISRD